MVPKREQSFVLWWSILPGLCLPFSEVRKTLDFASSKAAGWGGTIDTEYNEVHYSNAEMTPHSLFGQNNNRPFPGAYSAANMYCFLTESYFPNSWYALRFSAPNPPQIPNAQNRIISKIGLTQLAWIPLLSFDVRFSQPHKIVWKNGWHAKLTDSIVANHPWR